MQHRREKEGIFIANPFRWSESVPPRQPESMSVRLGISPIGWSSDDLPELGGDTPLDLCLAEARQAGFAGIELGRKFPRDPGVLRPILEGHELALVSGGYSGRLLDRPVA